MLPSATLGERGTSVQMAGVTSQARKRSGTEPGSRVLAHSTASAKYPAGLVTVGLHPSALYSLGNLFSFLTEIEIFLPDMASVRVHVLHSV